MKKLSPPLVSKIVLLFFTIFMLACNKSQKIEQKNAPAIPPEGKMIKTPDGIFLVEASKNGLSQITFENKIWQSMIGAAPDTLSKVEFADIEITICIIIANKEVRDCVGGIGFRCGFIKCPEESIAMNTQQTGIKSDRTYKAKLTIDNTTQKTTLEFLEPVNWDWLENS
jgi:hypothetical protein